MTPKTKTTGAGLALLGALLGACDPGSPTTTAPTTTAPTTASAPAAPPAAPPTACEPVAALAALDDRKPVPLQPMMAWHQKQSMMEHLVAIQQITEALAREDWQAVARASALIESSPHMQAMCQHMGAGADGFTELALEFHRRADAIGKAAVAEDGAAVLRATASSLATCTACHAAYRQDVVDAATWQARTGQAHDPATMHGGH